MKENVSVLYKQCENICSMMISPMLLGTKRVHAFENAYFASLCSILVSSKLDMCLNHKTMFSQNEAHVDR